MNESAPTNSEFIALQRQVAGRYSLDRELGRGGMGIVLLARDVALDRLVAIKLLPPKLAIDADLRERFLREARTAAGLSHPNIVPIHAVEEHGDIVFFVMGYVDGETLRQRVERAGPITSGEAVRLIQEVAWALAHAHAKNIVHRDIKPDNILLDKATGRAMVTDFGIARVMDAKGLTTAGELLGTASYMSPEQAAGEAADARSDLYSLGVTAFYALTGKLPFDAETVLAVLAMHVNEPAPPIASVRADIPAKLAEAVDRCLMKDPAARFQSGEELAEAAGACGLAAKQIPPQIRLFMRDAGSPLALLGGVSLGWFWFYAADPNLLFLPGLIGLTALVTLFATRRVLKDGMSFDDLRSALVINARARVEEREVLRRHRRDADLLKFARPVGVVGAIGLAAYATSVIVFGASNVPDAVWGVSVFLLSVGGAILLVRKPISMVNRWGAKLERKTDLLGHRLLGGPVGRLLFWIAGVGLKTKPRAVSAAGDATEVVLASAADSLFDALPSEHRRKLADVPIVIGRLQADAQVLRDRGAELAKVAADVGGEGLERDRSRLQVLRADPDRQSEADLLAKRISIVDDIDAERTGVRNRLAAVVAALENVRIDLLRLRAGLGSIEDITADLEAARRISDDIHHQVEARTEVEQLTESPSS